MGHEAGRPPWLCNCRLCRAIVLPLLASKSKGGLGGESTVGVGGEETVSEETSKGPGELNEVKELKELVAALRDSIMELKAALSDVSNPFLEESRMPRSQPAGAPNGSSAAATGAQEARSEESRVGEHESKEKEEEHAPRVVKVEKPGLGAGVEGEEERMLVPLSASSQLQAMTSHPVTGSGSTGGATQFSELGQALMQKTRAPAPSAGRQPAAGDLKKTLRILRVMYRLAQKLPSESLEHYIELMRTLGLVDERTARTVEILKSLIEVSKREGLTPEDHIIALYSLAKMLGVQDKELEEEVAMIMVEKLRNRSRESNPGSGEEVQGGDDEEDEGGGSQWGLPLQ